MSEDVAKNPQDVHALPQGQVRVVSVSKDAKYVVVVTYAPNTPETAQIQNAEQLGHRLAEWAESARPFFVLVTGNDAEVRFQRVDE